MPGIPLKPTHSSDVKIASASPQQLFPILPQKPRFWVSPASRGRPRAWVFCGNILYSQYLLPFHCDHRYGVTITLALILGSSLKNWISWSHWPRAVITPPRDRIVRMTSWMKSSYYVSIEHVMSHVSKYWKITTDNSSNSWWNWSNCLNRYYYT
jgi:hypothetical protein